MTARSPYQRVSPRPHEEDALREAFGEQVAALIPDRATVQFGIGRIPDAVLHKVRSHRGLGVDSEMLSDGVRPLAEECVING